MQAAACRALNQAIGRCIRHKHDYGGIILLDQRFGDTRNQRNLSCWCAASHLPLSYPSHSHALQTKLLNGPVRAMHTRMFYALWKFVSRTSVGM